MTDITRRAALRGLALVSATAGGTGVAYAVAVPGGNGNQHPLERLREIADEAAELMSHHDAAAGKPFELRIRAAATSPMPVAYFSLSTAPQDVWDNYRQRAPASARLQHHLLCAAMTADEMCAGSDRWTVFVGGIPGAWNAAFSLEQYVRELDPSRPDRGSIERREIVCQFANGRYVVEDGVGRMTAPSSLVALLHEWREAYDAAWGEEDDGPRYRRHVALADRAEASEAHSVEELAAKILMLTAYGEFALADGQLASVVDDAERIVGVPMPATLAAFRERSGAVQA